MHISDCIILPTFWYSKLDSLAIYIWTISQSICISSSNILIDKIITRFSKKSAYIIRIKNKPPFSLWCWLYIYFYFISRIQNQPKVQLILNLNRVGIKYIILFFNYLKESLLNIFMNNRVV